MMEVRYRRSFLRDLRKLKKLEIYDKLFEIAFETLPNSTSLHDLSDVRSLKDHPRRYRIRSGQYRLGLEIVNGVVELVRALHRRDFYRYFP